jgi:hypothetical protein
VTVNTEAAFCDNATCVVDQSIDVVKACRELVGQSTDVIQAIKITHKWCRANVRGHGFRPLGVSAHHGNSPRSPGELSRNLGTNSIAGAGDYGNAVHWTLSRWLPH